MKNKITPTDQELIMDKDHFIVSKTDTKGKFTYANRTFMQYSGYSEKELLGKQHNIIRHPKMPRAAFQALWDTVQSGQEFFAYVINLSKNGDHYWVWANITPDYDEQNNITGYFSVRRMPDFKAVKKVETIYAEMLKAEQSVASKNAMAAGLEVLTAYATTNHDSYNQFILSLSDQY